MNFLSVQPLGRNRAVPRLWIESQRLSRLGFPPGTPLEIRSHAGQLTLKPEIFDDNHVTRECRYLLSVSSCPQVSLGVAGGDNCDCNFSFRTRTAASN